jgi:hypothetical protein
MTKKLYEATITIYVMAENDIEAQIAATNMDEPFTSWDVMEVEQVEEKWMFLIPWGEDSDRCCFDIIEEMRQTT